MDLETLKAMLNASPMGASIFSMSDYSRIYSNTKALELFGAASEAELRSVDPKVTFVDPSQAHILAEQSAEVLAQPRREMRRRLDGSLWVSRTSRQRIDLNGDDVFLIWYQDITETEDSAERLRRIFRMPTVPMALYVAATKRWIDYNDAFLNLFGYERDEFNDLNWMDLTHPEDLQKNLIHFDKASREQGIEAYTLLKRFLHKSGDVIHARIHAEHIRTADGAPNYVVLVAEDITDAVRREHALEEQVCLPSAFMGRIRGYS